MAADRLIDVITPAPLPAEKHVDGVTPDGSLMAQSELLQDSIAALARRQAWQLTAASPNVVRRC